MAALSEADLLALVESGEGGGPLARARLMGAALLGPEAAGTAPLSDIDRAAWRLRRGLGGGPADAVCRCPACGETQEFALPAGFDLPGRHGATTEIACGGGRHVVRLPALSDFDGGRLDVARLAPAAPWSDPGFRADAEAALDALDPGLNLRIAMTCAACGADAAIRFDPLGFVWAELQTRARALIRQVARLARGFGWSERDILAMSPARRAAYEAEIGAAALAVTGARP